MQKELINLSKNYSLNPTLENAIKLVNWCQKEGGKITGFYPTNYVSQDDINSQMCKGFEGDNAEVKELNHEQMKKLAETIGEHDTENGGYWFIIEEYYNTYIK